VLRQLPNALSVLRLLIAGVFPFLGPGPVRVACFIVGALSDAVDGTIARRLHAQSWVGGILDGVADKALTLSVLLTLATEGHLAWFEVLVLMSRDLAVALIALVLAICRRWDAFCAMSARVPGKIATALLFACMLVILVRPAWRSAAVPPAMVASLVAALDYLGVFFRGLRRAQVSA